MPRISHPNTSDLGWTSDAYRLARTTQISEAFEIGGLSVAGVGLLALLTAPLPLGLFVYHIYLIWAGMTTNENQKWSDLREDMAEGSVFKCRRRDSPWKISSEPRVQWPIRSDQAVVCTTDGKAPSGHERVYEQIWSLAAIDNIYDLGFIDNLLYVLRAQ